MNPLTRRSFLHLGVVAGTGLVVTRRGLAHEGSGPQDSGLDPRSIPKYQSLLRILPVMPVTERRADHDYYAVEMRQFEQQMLPDGYPPTTVWGYGTAGVFFAPSASIEAAVGRPVRVKWTNTLVDEDGHFLPHLFTVDPTLHWANPPGGDSGRDSRPHFDHTPGPYVGPVPVVTHLHGGHSDGFSDGYPETWVLPVANDIPAGYATVGTHWEHQRSQFEAAFGETWEPGSVLSQYSNDQRATALWFHDHTLGLIRVNLYAGLVGLYLLRGGDDDLPVGVLPGPAPASGDPPEMRYYEVPMVIMDPSFDADGSLAYPTSRIEFDGFAGPYIGTGDSDISPMWNPERFGNTLSVNGQTWPRLEVEARRYRLRILNACSTRVLILKLVSDPTGTRPVAPALTFWQIGSDGGFLPAPVELEQLLIPAAGRVDVVVDFTAFPPGTPLFLINEAPDEPFNGEYEPADPETTGQVMKFVVGPAVSEDTSTPPEELQLPAIAAPKTPDRVRRVSLDEADSATLDDVGPRRTLLGTVDADGNPTALLWMDEPTEVVAAGATEIWEIYNFTDDAHPIHLHQVQVRIVDRQALITDDDGKTAPPARLAGSPMAPEDWELGTNDTVIAYPGQVTRIQATFDKAGLFVWHCHILEHEDNEMMRPLVVA